MNPSGSRRRRALSAIPALLIGAAAAGLLLTPELRIPGTRGAWRITEGFRPGRWEVPWLVARGPAAVVLPPEPLRVALTLSGPASAVLEAAGGPRRVVLEATPSSHDWVLPSGGRVSLVADAAIRLHGVAVRRDAGAPWGRVGWVIVACLLAAAFAVVRPGRAGVIVSGIGATTAAVLVVRGGLGSLVLGVGWDRFAPSLVLVALAASFLVVRLLPSRPLAAATPTGLPLLFGSLALASCLAQVLWLEQPLLIGDPAAYHDIGGRVRDAFAAVRSPDQLADALQTLRPYGGLWATGALYAAARAARDQLSTIYTLHALAVSGAVVFLVRAALRLGGPRLAALVGCLALLFPTFPVICGIVQPEPVILLLWTWSLDRLLAAREREDLRGYGMAGLAFALGLALHPQGMWFLLAALGLLLLPFASALARPGTRLAVAALLLGIAPVALTTAVGEAAARPALHVLDQRHGFWAYTAPYPLGFWLFIDSDGWQGPLRIDETRYARAFHERAQAGVATTVHRIGFTAGFVADNFAASVRAVLRNLHRLLHMPDNPFHRDWILPFAWQVAGYRAVVALFLLGVPLFIERRAAVALLPPLVLCATYPLYHIFNKYAVPATPFLLLGAALSVERLLAERPWRMLLALGAAAAGASLAPAELALRGLSVDLSHLSVLTLYVGGFGVSFFLASRAWARSLAARGATAAAAALLLVPSLAASWGDPTWRAFSVPLDKELVHAVEPGPDGVGRLNAAREAYLLLDLHLTDGDPSRLRLAFESGLEVAGRELQPTMPPFGLATLRGGRDPRTLRQWWRAPWRAEMARDGRVVLRVRGSATDRLYGDLRSAGEDPTEPSLSLGQSPYLSVYRLMHDGEYRLATRQPLSGTTRRSEWAGRSLPGLIGVRLAILDEASGGAAWETAPAPSGTVATGIWARAGRAARADVVLPAGRLRIDLEHPGAWSGPAGEVRAFPTGEYEGWFLIRTTAEGRGPLSIEVRPLQEMSASPKYFLPELRAEPPPLPPDWAGTPYVAPRRILESKDSPPWRPIVVF